jgi:hypothetical protein
MSRICIVSVVGLIALAYAGSFFFPVTDPQILVATGLGRNGLSALAMQSTTPEENADW